MQNRFRPSAIMLAVIITITACGGSQMTTIRPFEHKLNSYTALYFSAEPNVTENIDQEMADLEEQIIKKVNDSAFFILTRLGKCEDDCDKALNVMAVITDIHKVSSSGRFFGGAFAGKARLAAEVYFTDGKTGDTLGVYSVSGKSGGTGMAGGTETAVRRTGEEIFKLISENYK